MRQLICLPFNLSVWLTLSPWLCLPDCQLVPTSQSVYSVRLSVWVRPKGPVCASVSGHSAVSRRSVSGGLPRFARRAKSPLCKQREIRLGNGLFDRRAYPNLFSDSLQLQDVCLSVCIIARVCPCATVCVRLCLCFCLGLRPHTIWA